MTRGWESKSVEAQVQEFQDKDSGNRKRQLTPAQIEAHRRREVLLLSRSRVQKDLESSRNPRHQEQLRRALADIEAQLSELKDAE